MNWSYPREMGGFIHSITRGQYEQLNPVSSISLFASQVNCLAGQTAKDLGPAFLVAALIPFFCLRKMQARERGWILGLLMIYLCLSLFSPGNAESATGSGSKRPL